MKLLIIFIMMVSLTVASFFLVDSSRHVLAQSMSFTNVFPTQSTGQKDVIKYNAFTREWKYVPESSTLQYQPFEKKWEYVEPGKELKYNAIERRWEWAR